MEFTHSFLWNLYVWEEDDTKHTFIAVLTMTGLFAATLPSSLDSELAGVDMPLRLVFLLLGVDALLPCLDTGHGLRDNLVPAVCTDVEFVVNPPPDGLFQSAKSMSIYSMPALIPVSHPPRQLVDQVFFFVIVFAPAQSCIAECQMTKCMWDVQEAVILTYFGIKA